MGRNFSTTNGMARISCVKETNFPGFAANPVPYSDATLADVGRAALSLYDITRVVSSVAASVAANAVREGPSAFEGATADGTLHAVVAADGTDMEAWETLRRLKRGYGRLLTESDPGDRLLGGLRSHALSTSDVGELLDLDTIVRHDTIVRQVTSIATCPTRGLEVRADAASFKGECLENGVESMRREDEAICWYENAILLCGSVADGHAGHGSCSPFFL